MKTTTTIYTKSFFKILICVVACTSMLSSCITAKDTNLMQDIDIDYTTISPPDEYRIIPGDVLNIVVYVYGDEKTKELFKGYTPGLVEDYQVRNMSTHADGWGGGNDGATREGTGSGQPIPVYADGTINFPYIGRVFVQDLTLLEARMLLSERIKEISTKATVNVTLRNNFFSLIGESGPRRVEMKSNSMTIYQALASAGTISDYSERSRVNVIRQTKDGSTVMTFDLRTKDIMNTEFYYIQPNDVIYLPQKGTKFFGATNSFLGVFGLVTSFVTIIFGAFRLF